MTAPWDISGLTNDLNALGMGAAELHVSGLTLKPDGTILYATGTDNDKVYQYALSTPWDLTTGTLTTSISVLTSAGDLPPKDVAFKSDGLSMYVVYVTANVASAVAQFTLSTAWDVSTAVYASKRKAVQADIWDGQGLTFKSDGTRMYVCGVNFSGVGGTAVQYSLSTAWDVSTAASPVSLSTASQDTKPASIGFKTDGTRMFVGGTQHTTIYQYDLSTAWDLSTAVYNSGSHGMSGLAPSGMYFRSDGAKVFVLGFDGLSQSFTRRYSLFTNRWRVGMVL